MLESVTLKVLAKACGVSVGAVSQCLRNPENPRFSKETRQRILSKAQELNYVPNRLASSLRAGRTNFFSMVVPWNTPEMLDAAEVEAKRHGYGLTIHFTQYPDVDAERRAIQYVLGQRVDGLLWLPLDAAWGYTRTIRQIRQSGIRTVFLEAALPGLLDAGLVEVDYETSLVQALEGFRTTGCCYYIYLTPAQGHRIRARRTAVFQSFLQENDLEGQIYKVDDPESVRRVMEELPERCGVICDGDWAALDVIDFARERGLVIPEDVQLVVVGDMLIGGRFRMGELCDPPYAAIQRPSGEVARAAVRLLIDSLAKEVGTPVGRELLRAPYIKRRTAR